MSRLSISLIMSLIAVGNTLLAHVVQKNSQMPRFETTQSLKLKAWINKKKLITTFVIRLKQRKAACAELVS